jgi:hypothetical protein
MVFSPVLIILLTFAAVGVMGFVAKLVGVFENYAVRCALA